MLLNFGYARLHPPEYNAKVDLHPGDVVLFDASIKHFTSAHPGYPGEDTDRWAISCFFQKRVHTKMTCYAKEDLDMHHRLRQIMHQDKVRAERQAQAKLRAAQAAARTRKAQKLAQSTAEEATEQVEHSVPSQNTRSHTTTRS